ncbi:YfiR family protein [Salmonella enterica]|nr:YfiR family protein [Salmonella enterica]
MTKKILLAIALILTLALRPAPAQAQDQLAKPKAILTLSFIRYLGWSDAARKGDFVIGVVRDKEISTWLTSQSEGKKFGFQNVVVKRFKSIDEITDCQVVYISKNISFSRNASAIIDKVGKDTLIITEEEGATKNGSMINFVIRDSRLRFELSKANAQMGNIQFSQRLTDMTAAINM